jgi:hypothetical protein
MLSRTAAGFSLTLVIQLCAAHAAELDPQQIGLIRDTAASICNTVGDINGKRTDVQVQGVVKRQLNGLLGRFVGAGPPGIKALSPDEVEGLSHDATTIAVAGDRDCREHLFDKFFDKLTATPSGATGTVIQQTNGPNSPALNGSANVVIYNGYSGTPQSKSEKGLFIECHFGSRPRQMPAEGLYYLFVISDALFNISVEAAGLPGMQFPATPNAMLFSRKCTVTNYTDDVLIDISFKPILDFKTMIRRPDGVFEGHGVDHSREGLVNIPKIDVASDKAVVFYIENTSNGFVDITMPKSGMARRLGSTEPFPVPVVSNGPILGLGWLNEFQTR